MTILITNDDGLNAQGLNVLRKELKRISRTYVFAPKNERSGASHSFSLRIPIEVKWIDNTTACIDGTPTDCIMLAVRGLLKRRPDIIVSGINHGPNLGDDVTYSGTVAAAIEGALLGIPSISVSLVDENKGNFYIAAKFTSKLVQMVHGNGLIKKGILLNVNVPGIPVSLIRGVKITRLGKRIYRDIVVKRPDSDGRTIYTIEGECPSWKREKGTDFEAIERNYISVTPFQLDLTDHNAMRFLSLWEKALTRCLRDI